MIGLLLSTVYLKTTPQAGAVQLAFILVGIVACLAYLCWLYEHKWERKCCGGAPKDCKCGQCSECGLWWGKHLHTCSQDPPLRDNEVL